MVLALALTVGFAPPELPPEASTASPTTAPEAAVDADAPAPADSSDAPPAGPEAPAASPDAPAASPDDPTPSEPAAAAQPSAPAPAERVQVAVPAASEPAEAPASSETVDAGASGPALSPASDGAMADAAPPKTWQAELFVDLSYGFSSNWPDNHIYRGMYTSPRLHELAVNAVGAFVRHRVNDSEPWWFELGLHAGAAVDALTSAEPIPGGPDGKYAGAEVFKHIALANAGFRIRKTKTSLGAGVFEGPMGVGSFWTANNWNYTTSWESNVVPYYLAGAKIVQELPGNVEIAGWFVNGFQSYADLNAVPSGLVQLTWARPSREVGPPRTGPSNLTVSTNVYFGPESTDLAPQDWLVYWDTWASWDFDDHFSVAGVWDLGVDRPGRAREQQSLYTGGALFLRGTVFDRDNARIDLAVRPEASWDRDGRFFGVDQWLLSGTFSANLRLWDHLLLRAEYRYDHSTAEDGFFYHAEFTGDDDRPLASNQHTVFMAMTGWWDFWFGRAER
ncbi:outer membrane beta-barrel protein [Pseudenhygromyxa sp. WMMC2535]|uniref:outer membrane beta-barrel protein n=1 Tax=Pseudenhygromyxa sp. WMMC2535 TaxID=2712867 RepID=UPI00155525BD|nr:outer membrane beta-barrel protein [Pseudenhygromyxa sp. WMMC2535]NVB42270.1 outer membrane beta-barrel protein [Pseudenhygromyxa sp. WMMC2535]